MVALYVPIALLLAGEVDLLVVELTKVIMCIVMVEVDVSSLGRF